MWGLNHVKSGKGRGGVKFRQSLTTSAAAVVQLKFRLSCDRLGLGEGVEPFDQVFHRVFTQDLVVTAANVDGSVGELLLADN